MWQHDMEALARRWRAFGWHAIVIDGHDLDAILDALRRGAREEGSADDDPGQDVQGLRHRVAQDKEGWHGKALKPEEADRAVKELEATLKPVASDAVASLRAAIPKPNAADAAPVARPTIPPPSYKPGDSVATREAYGTALARLGQADSRVVALDADVGNSTFSERFEKVLPERFYENFIAEQVMIGAAMGLAARGAIPFPSTFACFLLARLRLHPHGRHQQPEREAGWIARRCVHR